MAFMSAACAVTVNFDGTVAMDYALNGTVMVGDSFSGSFTYDIPVPNAGGSYDDVITSFSLSLNGVSNSFDFSAPTTLNNITVTNTNATDSFTASAIFDPVTHFEVVNALDTTGNTFTNGGNALPTDFSFLFDNIDVFGDLFFAYSDFFGTGLGADFDGVLNSLYTVAAVPEPSVLGLLGLGLVLVSFSRKRKSV
jgi:hypothetical protein